MTLSVGYISDEIHILAFLSAEQSIHGLDNHLDDIDVLPLIETADVIGLGNLTLVENHIDGTGMIYYIQPVAHVLTLTIYWQWLAMTDIVDKQRNQLLRELIGAVVVRAVRHDRRHAVGVVEGAHEVVRAGFAGTVRAVRVVLGRLHKELLTVGQMVLARRSLGRERRLDALGVRHLQCAVHLVGRDMVEPLALVALGQALPIELRSLQQAQRAHHVRPCEGERVLDRAVHMTLGGQMDDAVDVVLFHQLPDRVEVADVGLHEGIVGLVLDVLEVGQVSCVCQLVEVDDVILRIFVHEKSYYV